MANSMAYADKALTSIIDDMDGTMSSNNLYPCLFNTDKLALRTSLVAT
eukprot:CAMPEP_0170086530 /NCGR_PEP_ID=MMETSP0019_2-20121128/21185_1 /TAXON_ID=98059 /ORGANISM="Dinobryon sp., Strain UTEXLB2267" /LENGTH=47 /DNA_ID= /DNA_START= /DNA_END= /DNA_ORIENTATION=